jgi:hypothetical protein
MNLSGQHWLRCWRVAKRFYVGAGVESVDLCITGLGYRGGRSHCCSCGNPSIDAKKAQAS